MTCGMESLTVMQWIMPEKKDAISTVQWTVDNARKERFYIN